MDGGADVHRGISAPKQPHDAHGDVVPSHCFRRGADVQAVGQYHIKNEAEGHAREHHQAELIVAGGVVPPEQGRDPRQQEEPAAIREDEPLVEGDAVIQRDMDDILRVFNGQVQPEEPDQIDQPVELEPQVRLEFFVQSICVHGFFSYIFDGKTLYFTTKRQLAQIQNVGYNKGE